MNNIHVCFSVRDEDGSYSKYLGIALISMLENTHKSIYIHVVLDESVTQENKNRIIELERKYDCRIFFYNIDTSKLNCFRDIAGIYSVGTLFRFFVADVLPVSIERVIYLDDDIIVNLDIEELWNINLESNLIAACHDQEAKKFMNVLGPCKDGTVSVNDYFNQGVLVLDLYKIRQQYHFFDLCINTLKLHPDYFLLDQDVFNVIFNGKIKYLPERFNIFSRYIRKNNLDETRCIIHFSADYAQPDGVCWIDRRFFQYWNISSWREEILPYIFSCIVQKNKVISLLKKVVNVLANTDRKVFVWGVKSVLCKELMETFIIKERIIGYIDSKVQAENEIQRVYAPKILKEKEYKDAFIIVTSKKYYSEIKSELESMGKRENEDFIDACELLEKRR